MASSSSSANKAAASLKTNQDPPHPLNCPRCDSSNTKFCYYNNYSLSQPRHFCKACKRYWTRGGTLRNVPVGGACRKNKRHKRPSALPSAPSSSNHLQNHNQNKKPLFYGLHTANDPMELSFPFSNNFRVSSELDLLHPQINNDLGLGFSMSGFKPIQDSISNSTSSPFLLSSSANTSSILFGSSSSSTMASLLVSTLQQQKSGTIQSSLMTYEDPQMGGIGKQVKAEEEEQANRLCWNPNPIDQINSSDPFSLLWNSTSIGAWFDPSTMGSSIPSLI